MTIPPAVPWMRRLRHRPPEPVAPAPTAASRQAPTQVPHQRIVLQPSVPGPVTPPPPAPASTGGLTQLGGGGGAPASRPRFAVRAQTLTLVPPPGVSGTATLDEDDPVLRFDAIQSGVGVLEIRGAERVAWEHVQDLAGVVAVTEPSTGDDVPTPGNRVIVGVQDDLVLVTLRHVRSLRRLLVDAAPDTAVTVTAVIGGTIRAADPAQRVRISVVVVDGRLELRTEYGLPDDWRTALAAMGWSPLASIPR